MTVLLALVAAVPVAVLLQHSNDRSDSVVTAAGGGAPSTGPDGIFRPLLDLEGCVTTQASERTLIGAGEPMNAAASTQVIHQPGQPPPSGPLVIVFRSQATTATADPNPSGAIAFDPVEPGRQGGATWTFTDGSQATAYARNISTEEFVVLVKSLRPTATDGFLLQPTGLPDGYVSTRISPTSPSATVATSRCESAGDPTKVLTVTAVSGSQPAAFVALHETSASAATGRRGDTMLFVDGASQPDAEAALTRIRDATPEEWARLRTDGEVSPGPSTPPTTG